MEASEDQEEMTPVDSQEDAEPEQADEGLPQEEPEAEGVDEEETTTSQVEEEPDVTGPEGEEREIIDCLLYTSRCV